MTDDTRFDLRSGTWTLQGLTTDQVRELKVCFQALFGVDPAILAPAQIRQRVAARIAFQENLYTALQGLVEADREGVEPSAVTWEHAYKIIVGQRRNQKSEEEENDANDQPTGT